MSILYWITILGNLNTLGQVLLTILLIVSCATVLYPLIVDPIYETDEIRIKFFNIAKKSLLYSIIPILIVTFIPSTEQLYAIYGVGTVIDYAKNSKEVQKLPDNAVKALNVWLEDVNKDNKNPTDN